MESPFWERYPSKFREKDGVSLFSEEVFLSAEHLQWLPETYFPVVAQVHRYPRYKNNRSVDTFVKCYLDENQITEQPDWGLPVPNQEAAYKSLSKYAKDVLPMADKQVKAMNQAWEWTERHFFPYMGGARIKTVREVIDDLDMSTSSGYPFNVFYPKKKDLFDNWGEAEQWLESDWNQLLDEQYSFCFTNSLKEEIRPTVKTEQNKIRTFTAGAVDGTVHGNRLFSDMNERMNAGYLRSSSGVGMSPLKGNWDRLYRKLNVFRNGYALDESEYDSSLRAYMMWGCAQLRWKMLRPEEKTKENYKRIQVYYRNLVNSLVITPQGVIVMKLGGNPSGSVNTINDNTLILYTLLAYAWIILADDPMYEEFELNTSKILVGDDNTWTVSDWAHKFFNATSVIDVWGSIGVTTTTDSLAPRPAKELDFLSAKTIFYMGQAIPVYDRTKLMTSLLYSETQKQSPAFTLLRAAALLQIGWSDAQFRRFSREFIEWLIWKFDDLLESDQDWITAKSSVLNDERLAELFTGERYVLEPQSVAWCNRCQCEWRFCGCDLLSGDERKIIKPDKRMSQPTRSQKSRSRRGKGAKATRQPQKAKVVLINPKDIRYRGPGSTMEVGTNRKRRGRRGKGKGGGGGMFPTTTPMGRGRTQNVGTNRRSQVLIEDEFIGAVSGSTGFAATQFAVNMGQAGTFPWGSQPAKNYQKYQFDSLEFYYKREVSEFATNGQAGKIMLFFNPDAADPAPTTKQQVEDSQVHADAMPCENFKLVVPPSMLKKMNDAMFIRPGAVVGNTDIKTYDIGNLFVCTQGNTNTTEVGELHVRYRCRVFIPVIQGLAGGAPQNNVVSWFQDSASQTVVTTVATTLLLATATANGLGAVNTAGSIVPPQGNYIIDAWADMADSAAEAFSGFLDVKKNGTSLFIGPPSFNEAVSVGATAREFVAASCFVACNGTDAITIVATMVGAAGTLQVTQASARFLLV